MISRSGQVSTSEITEEDRVIDTGVPTGSPKSTEVERAVRAVRDGGVSGRACCLASMPNKQ